MKTFKQYLKEDSFPRNFSINYVMSHILVPNNSDIHKDLDFYDGVGYYSRCMVLVAEVEPIIRGTPIYMYSHHKNRGESDKIPKYMAVYATVERREGHPVHDYGIEQEYDDKGREVEMEMIVEYYFAVEASFYNKKGVELFVGDIFDEYDDYESNADEECDSYSASIQRNIENELKNRKKLNLTHIIWEMPNLKLTQHSVYVRPDDQIEIEQQEYAD